jgi:hypothetical protein
MHKLESFALSCGLKISKPKIQKTFYPLVDKHFICMSNYSNSPDNEYDYWDDVIFHMKPFLDNAGIAIYEIGSSEKENLFYCKSLKHLNRLQINYVLSKSTMYIGNYNFFSHIASYYNKPFISTSKNDFIETNQPYWNKDKDCILLPETENKPYFNLTEPNKSINEIMPEDIAVKVLNKLKIKHNLNNIKTIHIGSNYTERYIDIIPGDYNPNSFNYDGNVTIRMDKSFNLNFLNAVNRFKGVNIITKKVIPKTYLQNIKDKINKIVFFIDKKTKDSDIELLQSIGCNLKLVCDDSKSIQSIRFKFLDYDIEEYSHKTKKDLNCKSLKNLEFLSRKNIIFQGSAFNSNASIKEGKNISHVINSSSMWEDLDYIRIYEKKS